MELSHYLVYILLSMVKTTSSFPSENRDFSLGASDYNTDDDTFVINIAEDSDTADDLAKRVLSALSALNNRANRVPNQQRGKLYRARRVRRKTLGNNERVQMIFGKDERVNLSSSREAQIYPYYTAVMLSSGCTGTLIGPQHVLTAAHCVHNGKKRLKKAKHLQVGFLQHSGRFHWIRVQRKYIPRKWKEQPPQKDRLRYDFAVLKLIRRHNRQPMSVSSSSLLPGSRIQFSGFHGDKAYNSLWFTRCRVKGKSNDMIFNRCDGFKGISGSGVYVGTPRGDENVVVGVVSAIGRGTVRGRMIQFNLVNSLTKPKVKQISKWVARR